MIVIFLLLTRYHAIQLLLLLRAYKYFIICHSFICVTISSSYSYEINIFFVFALIKLNTHKLSHLPRFHSFPYKAMYFDLKSNTIRLIISLLPMMMMTTDDMIVVLLQLLMLLLNVPIHKLELMQRK